MQIDISLWIEIAALVTSLVLWPRIKHSFFKYFPLLLLMIVAAELSGAYMGQVLHKSNYPIYNITSPISTFFYCLLFYQYLRAKKIVVPILIVFILFTLINLFFLQGIGRFNSYTLILGSLILVILSCLYLYEMLYSEEYIVPVKQPMFWITVGLLFSCLISLLYWGSYELQIDVRGQLFRLIVKNAVILRYTSFIIAFYVHKHK